MKELFKISYINSSNLVVFMDGEFSTYEMAKHHIESLPRGTYYQVQKVFYN